MPEDRSDLEARARWCRRLARDCGDAGIETSLKQLAVDLDRRAADAGDRPAESARTDSEASSIR